MKYIKKIGGVVLLLFAVASAIFIFHGKIKDGNAKCWNAAPFIFAESIIIVISIGLITTPIKVK